MERKELTVIEPENGNGLLSIPAQQEESLKNAASLAQHVAKIVKDNGLAKRFGSSPKEHVFVEGWLTISRVNNEAPHARVEGVERHGDHEVIKARAWITDSMGGIVSEADGYCSTEEKNWADKPFYARASMAQTRAIGKAMRLRHAWVMVMAGFSPTPAEEMSEDFAPVPAPSKPKMKVTQQDGQKVYTLPPDPDRVPAEVTDATAPDAAPAEGLESVVLKAYSKEKTDKKGNTYRGVLLVHGDGEEKWWNCYDKTTIANLQGMKEKPVNAKLEMKGEYPLCHKLEVLA